MLPSEFFQTFGRVDRVRVSDQYLIDNGFYRVLPDEDRYLLGVCIQSGNLNIWFDSQDTTNPPDFLLTNTLGLILFTHALHGSLPATGMSIGPSGIPQGFTVLTGTMNAPQPNHRGEQNGKAILAHAVPQQRGKRSGRSSRSK